MSWGTWLWLVLESGWMLFKGNMAVTGPVCLLVLFGAIFWRDWLGKSWQYIDCFVECKCGKGYCSPLGGWKGEEVVPQLRGPLTESDCLCCEQQGSCLAPEPASEPVEASPVTLCILQPCRQHASLRWSGGSRGNGIQDPDSPPSAPTVSPKLLTTSSGSEWETSCPSLSNLVEKSGCILGTRDAPGCCS